MSTTVTSGDLHGRWNHARELFRRIGMIDCPSDDPMLDVRQPGFHHIQLGDAVSLGYGMVEAAFYRWLVDVVGVDQLLLGNHELPSVWWHPNAVMFTGYHDRDEIRDEIDRDQPSGSGHYWAEQYPWQTGRDREAEKLVRSEFSRGRYTVAASVGDWLITHAGLAAQHERNHGLGAKSSKHVADYLNDLFRSCLETRRDSPALVSPSQHAGGIMWLRIEFLRNGYDDDKRTRPQIVGHSGYMGPRRFGSRLWLVDMPTREVGGRVEGGVAALVTDDEGETLELEIVEPVDLLG